MKIHTYRKKTTFELLQNVNSIFQSIRKNFWKKADKGSGKVVECVKPPKLSINSKVALVFGGSNNGFGFSAAEQMLRYGAKRVIIADNHLRTGLKAVDRLCKAYGKDRAKFYHCNITNSCHVEGAFACTYCNDERVNIIFNDVDAIQKITDASMTVCGDKIKINHTMRISRIAIETMTLKHGYNECFSGIIINCASILGFVGWPKTPEPIYCGGEATIETSMDIAKSYPEGDTGIRIVTICPSTRAFGSIGLPDFPEQPCTKPNWLSKPTMPSCFPDPVKDRDRIGKALEYLVQYAENGSVWVIQPPFTLNQIPKLVTFPEEEKK